MKIYCACPYILPTNEKNYTVDEILNIYYQEKNGIDTGYKEPFIGIVTDCKEELDKFLKIHDSLPWRISIFDTTILVTDRFIKMSNSHEDEVVYKTIKDTPLTNKAKNAISKETIRIADEIQSVLTFELQTVQEINAKLFNKYSIPWLNYAMRYVFNVKIEEKTIFLPKHPDVPVTVKSYKLRY